MTFYVFFIEKNLICGIILLRGECILKKYTRSCLFKENEAIVIERSYRTNPEELHTHDFIEIVYITSGGGVQQINSNSFKVSAGSLLFINCTETHAFVPDPYMDHYNILIKPEYIDDKIINKDNAFELLSLTMFSEFKAIDQSVVSPTFSGREALLIEQLITEMYEEYKSARPGYQTVLKGYTIILLTHIFRKMIPGVCGDQNIFPEITDFISSHYNEKITLEQLAEKSFYSPKYFSKVFKSCYGVTVQDYIKIKRLEEGARLLLETNLTVRQISVLSGYPDPVHFFKYFKARYKMTPLEYRNTKRQST